MAEAPTARPRWGWPFIALLFLGFTVATAAPATAAACGTVSDLVPFLDGTTCTIGTTPSVRAPQSTLGDHGQASSWRPVCRSTPGRHGRVRELPR